MDKTKVNLCKKINEKILNVSKCNKTGTKYDKGGLKMNNGVPKP